MTHRTVKLGLPLLLALAAGCTTMGTGFGSTAAGADPVTFSWKSSDSVSGTMSATLIDGKQYSGQFFEITKDTRVDNLGPLWTGWNPGWRGFGGFDYWDAGPSFVTHYSGAGRGQSRCSGRCAHALQISTRTSLARDGRRRPRSVSDARRQDHRCDLPDRLKRWTAHKPVDVRQRGARRSCNS